VIRVLQGVSGLQLLIMGLHAALVPKRGLFIDGHWVEPLKGKRIPIVNPTTEESVGMSFCW